MDAIVLAGGFGTRLREVVADVPKPLAPIRGTPFLDILLSVLAKEGCFSRVIISVGYKGEMIEQRYRAHNYPFEVLFAKETAPLGTGGALINALQYARGRDVMACNGDSLYAVSMKDIHTFHLEKGGIATIIARRVEDVSPYGALAFDESGKVRAFHEKTMSGEGVINAGIYFFDREKIAMHTFPEAFSLEKEGFPMFLHQGVYALEKSGTFIDIGTKETYNLAQTILEHI